MPDELHPRVIKELAEELSEPLSIIFAESWKTGEVPDDWRRANVVPIFKKGKKKEPGNYRPISLTPITGKILEQIIKKLICKHLALVYTTAGLLLIKLKPDFSLIRM